MHISAVENIEQVRRDILEDICQRFNTFLIRQRRAKKPSKGLLIIDHNQAGSYRQLIYDFKMEVQNMVISIMLLIFHTLLDVQILECCS